MGEGFAEAVVRPRRYSWRRWRGMRRLSSLLYTSGVTRSGGMISWRGDDPHGAVYTLPSWRDVAPRRGRMRPYFLFLPRWWWECQIGQGWMVRGRHWPEEPFIGMCAACCPCPECGAHRECDPGCPTLEAPR